MDCVSQICRSVQSATMPCDRIQKRKVPEILAHPGKNINETFPAHSQDSILMPSRLSFPRVLYSSRRNERPSMHTVKYQCFVLPCHDKKYQSPRFLLATSLSYTLSASMASFVNELFFHQLTSAAMTVITLVRNCSICALSSGIIGCPQALST